MRDIARRIKNIEKRLNLSEKPQTITIIHFGEELPPDRTDGNITVHFVRYDDKEMQ